MTCPLHTAPQSFCARCAEVLIHVRLASIPEMTPAERVRQRESFASGNVKIGEPEVTFVPSREVMGDRPRTVMLRAIEAKPTGPGCAEHWWTKSDCDACAANVPLVCAPSPSHDAQAARIAGLEANVNARVAAEAALRRDLTNACATITDITDALGITGPHQGIDDSEALAAVREYVKEQRGVIDKLRDEVARLSAVESVAITAARISALATALRKSLADVDPKAMSTYEQQQARREARALLEEVA